MNSYVYSDKEVLHVKDLVWFHKPIRILNTGVDGKCCQHGKTCLHELSVSLRRGDN